MALLSATDRPSRASVAKLLVMTLVKVKGAALKGRCKKKDRKKTRRGWAVRRRVLFFSLLLQNPIIGFLGRQRDTEKPRRFKNRDTFPERIGRRTGGGGRSSAKNSWPRNGKEKKHNNKKKRLRRERAPASAEPHGGVCVVQKSAENGSTAAAAAPDNEADDKNGRRRVAWMRPRRDGHEEIGSTNRPFVNNRPA